jgi:hypothetical protein
VNEFYDDGTHEYRVRVKETDKGTGVALTCACGWDPGDWGDSMGVALGEVTQEWLVHYREATSSGLAEKVEVYTYEERVLGVQL